MVPNTEEQTHNIIRSPDNYVLFRNVTHFPRISYVTLLYYVISYSLKNVLLLMAVVSSTDYTLVVYNCSIQHKSF